MKKLSLICLALLLSACNSSETSFGFNGGLAPIPAPTADTTVTRLTGIVGATSEETEADDVSSVALTAPDDTEPAPL